MSAQYTLGKLLLTPLSRVFCRLRVEGREHLPRTGPVIVASNHLSFLDSIAIPVAAPRQVHFLTKSSYFDAPGIKGTLQASFFTSIGAVPVRRGAGQAALDALEQQRELLAEGKAVALYPEGTRSRDGRLYRGRTGVAHLALLTGAPVVPVGLIGTDRVIPAEGGRPRFGQRVTVRFGERLHLGSPGEASNGRARREATATIMDAIHALTGQERAESYNSPPSADSPEAG